MPRDLPRIALAVSSVLLLTVAGSWLAARARVPPTARESRAVPSPGPGERLVTLEVDGMTCGGCASRLADELRAVPGVAACDVSASTGRAVVACAGSVREASLLAAVTRAGAGFTASIAPH